MVFKAGIILFILAGVAYVPATNPDLADRLLGMAEAHGIAVMAGFSLLISMIAIWRLVRVQKSLNTLQAGIDQFERHINEKFDAIPRQLSSDQPLGTRIPLPNPASSLSPLNSDREEDTLQTRFDFDTHNLSLRDDTQEEADNVVPFLRLVQNDEPSVAPKKTAEPRSFNKSSFHLRLQPVIDLETRQTHAFEIIPGFTKKDDSFLPLGQAMNELGKTFSAANCDLQTLRSATTLIKPLRSRAGDTQFYLPLNGAILDKPKLFAEFLSILKRNRALRDVLVLGISQTKLNQVKRAGKGRIVDMCDLGFRLALMECVDVKQAHAQVAEGPFESLHVSNAVLEQLEVSTAFSADIEQLRNAARDGMNIIVKAVSEERQVMRLLDRHVPMASGPFFSEPKLPAMDASAKPAEG